MSHGTPTAQAENKDRWKALKGRLIAHFGTINEAARVVGCSPNAVRLAGLGICPQVLDRLEKELKKPVPAAA